MKRHRYYGPPRGLYLSVKRSSKKRARRSKRAMKGGFLSALIPIIAAAISAAPAIAGTVIAAKNSK